MVIAGGKDIDETVVLTERCQRRDKFLHLVFYFTSFQLSVDAACMPMALWCQLGLIADGVFSFREIRLSPPAGCDYRDYRNFLRLRDYCSFTIIAKYFVLLIITIIAIIVSVVVIPIVAVSISLPLPCPSNLQI
jgi:hypothetical protein